MNSNERELEAGRRELQELEAQLAGMEKKIVDLKRNQTADLEKAAVADLLKVAEQKAAAAAAVAGARLARDELKRRAGICRSRVAELEKRHKMARFELEEAELGQMARKIADTELTALALALEALQERGDGISRAYGITPFWGFSSSLRQAVEHQIEFFDNEWQTRMGGKR